MPFKSEKQRRYLHANHPEIAKRWEREYSTGTGYKGVLSLEDEESEDISLTAFNPKFDDVPELTEEKEEEKINLFSETEEGDPLNNLLLAEDGVTTLFRAKNGGNATKNIKGQPHMLAYITPGEAKTLENLGGQKTMTKEGIPAYPPSDNYGGSWGGGSTNQGPAGGASSGGNYGGNQNTGKDDNKGSDHGHSRFDVGSGYYGEEVTTSSDDGDDKPYKDPILGMVDKKKIPGTKEYIDAEKTDWVEVPARKSPLTGKVRPRQVVPLWKANQFEKIDKYVDEIAGSWTNPTEFFITKQIVNFAKNKLPFGMLIPTIYPKVNLHGEVIKDHVPGSDLGHFQGKEWDHLWENAKDENDQGGRDKPQVVPATEEIQDYTEMAWDPFNYLDQIRAKQALRASLQAKGIIQDNEVMLNSGGLANLFRVKN